MVPERCSMNAVISENSLYSAQPSKGDARTICKKYSEKKHKHRKTANIIIARASWWSRLFLEESLRSTQQIPADDIGSIAKRSLYQLDLADHNPCEKDLSGQFILISTGKTIISKETQRGSLCFRKLRYAIFCLENYRCILHWLSNDKIHHDCLGINAVSSRTKKTSSRTKTTNSRHNSIRVEIKAVMFRFNSIRLGMTSFTAQLVIYNSRICLSYVFVFVQRFKNGLGLLDIIICHI